MGELSGLDLLDRRDVILDRLAEQFGLKIVHLPIGTISPTTIKRIRVMHILSGYDKRDIAREYIW